MSSAVSPSILLTRTSLSRDARRRPPTVLAPLAATATHWREGSKSRSEKKRVRLPKAIASSASNEATDGLDEFVSRGLPEHVMVVSDFLDSAQDLRALYDQRCVIMQTHLYVCIYIMRLCTVLMSLCDSLADSKILVKLRQSDLFGTTGKRDGE